MKQQPQVAFTLQSDFSKLKVNDVMAQDNTHVELAIYDLMVDGVSRTVNQIVRTLVTLGYEPSHVNKRMVGLLYKKEWFVEGTLSGKPSYKLKKSAKRTIALTAAAKGLESVKASDIVVRSSAEQPFSSASKTPQTVEVTYKRNRSLIAKENTMPQEPTPQPADKPAQYIVLPEDPVKTALWKVMADHAWYKRSDLEVLLNHIKLRTINMSLEQMEVDNLVVVDRSNVKEGFRFRLSPGAPMPEGGRPYKQRTFKSKATPPQPQLPLENQPMQSDIPEGTFKIDDASNIKSAPMTTDDSAAEPSAMQILGDAIGGALQPHMAPVRAKEVANPDVPATRNVADFPGFETFSMGDQPKEKSPLIEVAGIRIKGTVFSYKEAREILKELRAYGFGSEHFRPTFSIASFLKMERHWMISGVQFTEFELNDLALSLAEELE